MKNIKWIIIAIIIFIIILFATQNKPADNSAQRTGPIKIGFIGPLTGDAASLGENSLIAATIAIKEINEKGGINGQLFEIIAEDGKCAGKDAINAAQKLINVDKVVAIVGGLCSGESSSFTGLLSQTGTPAISTCSSAATLTEEGGDYFFRSYPSDAYQSVFAAEYIKDNLNINKVAVIYVNNDWGVGLQKSFVDTFKSLGGEILFQESYEQDERDLRTQLIKAKSAQAELIYFLSFDQAAIAGIKQYNELNLNIPVFGGDAWDDMTIWNDVGDISNGFMYPVPKTKNSDAFKQKMSEAGVDEVTVCAAQGYDNVNIFASVITEVGVDKEAIKNALYSINYTEGVSANSVSFDENGDLVGAEYIVKQNNNGEIVEL